MKKHFKKILVCLTMLFMIVCCHSFFQTNIVAKAATFGNASPELKLVGNTGFQPQHYFDTFQQSKILSGLTYASANGKVTSQNYAIGHSGSNIFGAYSQGVSTFTPFSDYVTLANAGVLFASAKIGVVTKAGEQNKITIGISHNGNSYQKKSTALGTLSNNIYYPNYFETQKLKVSAGASLSFEFINGEKTHLFKSADFLLFEPSVIFSTSIEKIAFANENQNTFYNDVIKLQASNSVLDITATGDLISHFKTAHKIEYEIVEGANLATVVGNYLYFTGNNSGTVKLRAKALKNSDGAEFVYSKTVTYNYIATQRTISVLQNFADGAKITGEGQYYTNQKITLIPEINQGFEFSHWLVNGEKVLSKNLLHTVAETNDIQLFMIKSVSVSEIVIGQKEYDGTKDAQIEQIIVEGFDAKHEVSVFGLAASFYSANAGLRLVEVSGTPSLQGADAKWYKISKILPTTQATILPKQALIEISNITKTYGEQDPAFAFELSGVIEQDTAIVTLSRAVGEDVGQYNITASVDHPNYVFTVLDAKLTIITKQIFAIEELLEKEYDGTSEITFSPSLNGVLFNDDVNLQLVARFETKNAGQNLTVEIVSYSLQGSKSQNYSFEKPQNSFLGNILPKDLNIIFQNASKIYGQVDPSFIFEVKGLVEGEVLQGLALRAVGENVGTYLLEYQTNNTNYRVAFNRAHLTILKKQISLHAKETAKIYGETDPILSFTTNGLVGEDSLSGSLSRQIGENVGVYQINQGTLTNPNYEIAFSPNTFQIKKRTLQGAFRVSSKIYDGTVDIINLSYSFTNLVSTDIVTVHLSGHFESKNVGTNINIMIEEVVLSNENYLLNVTNLTADILPREVLILSQNQTKIYGNPDNEIAFSASNLVQGEHIVGKLTRVEGENVGSYQIGLEQLINQENSNYNFTFEEIYYYTILKRELTLQIVSATKAYGQPDPKIVYETINLSLAFNDTFESVLSGQPARISGEMPGIYKYKVGNIFAKSANYTLVFVENGQLTITKANLTITAKTATKTYGEQLEPYLTYDTDVETETGFAFMLARTLGENVGTYEIYAQSLYSDRYNITFVSSVFTITPRELTLKADDKIKYYGDTDPEFTHTIISGILVNNDTFKQVLFGKPERQVGEELDAYSIGQGTLEISANYSLSFIAGTLTIEKQNITIKANALSKQFGHFDPELTFEIVSGKLATGDVIVGSLQRAMGEALGNYDILQGSLVLSSNYLIHFISAKFSILKAQITVNVLPVYKTYGEPDPSLEYVITQGFLASGEELIGGLWRDSGEEVGVYSIFSNFSNPNYEIEFQLNNFQIIKRVVVIKSKSYTITYNQSLPKLEFEIISGSVMQGDEISGDIYKVEGTDAGTYDINSTQTLGRNYALEFIKGKVQILPINLGVSVEDANKIYGQKDPYFEYRIMTGELVGDDRLIGGIIRQEGENVGFYEYVSAFSNINYAVEVVSGIFQIKQKEARLYVKAYNKIFDGTTFAELYQPQVVGIIDTTVTLEINLKTSAKFTSANVGNDIEITLENISLVGDGYSNYKLILPEVKASITHDKLSENVVEIKALNNVELFSGISLLAQQTETQTKLDLPKIKKVINQFDIALTYEGENVTLTSAIQVNVNLQNKNHQNLKVYLLSEDGELSFIASEYKNGILSFNTSEIGNVIIVGDNLQWLNVSAIISLVGLLTLFAISAVVVFKRKISLVLKKKG